MREASSVLKPNARIREYSGIQGYADTGGVYTTQWLMSENKTSREPGDFGRESQ